VVKSIDGGLRARPEWDKNPFMSDALNDIDVKIQRRSVHTSDGTRAIEMVSMDGEIEKSNRFVQYIEMEEKRFVKEYIEEMSRFFRLSKCAENIYRYIKTILPKEDDRIIFNRKECMEYLGYKTHKSIIDGLVELIDSEIIARTLVNDVFFINPLIVFNGSRVSFAKTFVKKENGSKPEAKQLEENNAIDIPHTEINENSDYIPVTDSSK